MHTSEVLALLIMDIFWSSSAEELFADECISRANTVEYLYSFLHNTNKILYKLLKETETVFCDICSEDKYSVALLFLSC